MDFDKPKLIDRSFLKKVINNNSQKNFNKFKDLWDLIKQNLIIVLFIGLLAYFLYYRYTNTMQKKEEPQEIIQQQVYQDLTPQYHYQMNSVLNNQIMQQTRQQTRFIPSDQQYSVPRQPQQDPYLCSTNNTCQNNNLEEKIDNQNNDNIQILKEKTVDPINLNFNNYQENNQEEKKILNDFDYSLKTRSATYLSPQYIGPNFAPA